MRHNRKDCGVLNGYFLLHETKALVLRTILMKMQKTFNFHIKQTPFTLLSILIPFGLDILVVNYVGWWRYHK